MCLSLYDLLIIGEMVRDRGYASGLQVVPIAGLTMITARDNHIWRAQNQDSVTAFLPMGIIAHCGIGLL